MIGHEYLEPAAGALGASSQHAVSQHVASATINEAVTSTSRTSAKRELVAPGHPYNPRTGTGIEWFPADPATRSPGIVRLWVRTWNGEPAVLAEAEHMSRSQEEYWYNLAFADSFPDVTHWWFGDAWTGIVRIWGPVGASCDPESGLPMLNGWMRFGSTETGPPESVSSQDSQDSQLGQGSAGLPDDSPSLPWSVVISNPVRVLTPMPPLSPNPANLPLQLLLAESIMDMLQLWIEHDNLETAKSALPDLRAPNFELAMTSLVSRENLQQAFPPEFGAWRLDRLHDLTPREALCRVMGLKSSLVSEARI